MLKRHAAFLLAVVLMSCGTRNEKLPAGHEATAQTALDGISRAFVWVPQLSGGLGATVSQPYQVWLQSLQKDKAKSLILEADKTEGMHLAWKAPNRLEICYGDAQITYFRNFFVVAEEDSPSIYQVEITLKRANKLDEC